jgi:hypothetical protein
MNVRREIAVIGAYLEVGARLMDMDSGQAIVLSVKLKRPDNVHRCVDLQLPIGAIQADRVEEFLDALERELETLREEVVSVERMQVGVTSGDLPS